MLRLIFNEWHSDHETLDDAHAAADRQAADAHVTIPVWFKPPMGSGSTALEVAEVWENGFNDGFEWLIVPQKETVTT